MANTANKVIAIAKAEVGYLEKKSNKNLDSKTANAGSANYTKYNAWMGVNPAYWCASFVSWCFNQAYGSAGKSLLGGAYSTYCETIRKNFVKKNRYYTSSPKAGDVIFFTGSRHSGANHIGIVYQVSGGKVYTVEGNTSGGSNVIDNGGGVALKSYAVGNSRIMGYGRPAYDSTTTSTAKTWTGGFPTLPSRGYFKIGDGYKYNTSYDRSIRLVQNFLNWAVGAGLTVDGDYGTKTAAAVKTFQKKAGITVDGEYGKNTLAKAKSFTK